MTSQTAVPSTSHPSPPGGISEGLMNMTSQAAVTTTSDPSSSSTISEMLINMTSQAAVPTTSDPSPSNTISETLLNMTSQAVVTTTSDSSPSSTISEALLNVTSQAVITTTSDSSPSSTISELINITSQAVVPTTSDPSPSSSISELINMTRQGVVPTTSNPSASGAISVESIFTIANATVGAVGILVVIVIMLAVIVSCRGKLKSKSLAKHDVENTEPDHTKRKLNKTEENKHHNSIADKPVSNRRVKSATVDQYAKVVPRSLRASAPNNSTFRVETDQAHVQWQDEVDPDVPLNGGCQMVENDIYVNGSADENTGGGGKVGKNYYYTKL